MKRVSHPLGRIFPVLPLVRTCDHGIEPLRLQALRTIISISPLNLYGQKSLKYGNENFIGHRVLILSCRSISP